MWGRKPALPGHIVHPQAGTIAIKIHARAKRLRLLFRSGQFSLTVPPGTSEYSIQRFVDQTTPWITKQLSTAVMYPDARIVMLEKILFQGEDYRIIQQPMTGRSLYQIDKEQKIIIVDAVRSCLSKRLAYLCRKEFQKLVSSSLTIYSTAMGLYPAKVSIRDTRSRWGSCSSTGNISLSWRLVMAPPEVMNYVIIHELAHLRHMNHSEGFWRLVAQYCPDFRQSRNWLKVNAAKLHAF